MTQSTNATTDGEQTTNSIEVTFTVDNPRAEKHGENVTVTCDSLEESPMTPNRLVAFTDGEHVTSFGKSQLVSVEGI